jgi:hypothetical protein
VRWWAAIPVLALVGCGAGAEKAEDVSPVTAPAPPGGDAMPNVPDREVHIQDAERELERAERTLDVGIAARRAGPPGVSPPTPPTPPEPGPTSPKPGTKPPSENTTPQAGSSCETACIALASMKRSAKYLCELSGTGDARCSSAEDRVKRAERRVREVCGSCNEPAAFGRPACRWVTIAGIDGPPLSTAPRDP